MPTVGREATATTGSAVAHTAVSENVSVKSVVSTETQSKVNMENTQKMSALMSKLGTTHQQVDEYARRRTEQISEGVAATINQIVADTQNQQATLLADANVRSAAIEEEYKHKLQQCVQELDAVKAQNLSTLEKDLNFRQEMILESAKKRIDDLNEEGNRLKLGVLREAQAQTNAKIEAITEQVAQLGAEDASHLLTSSSTTVITTEAKATGETHVAGTAATANTTATTVEKSSASHSSSSATTKH
ncbi:unnamed protein product [Rotaria sp. Silwood2]|nr:unnamed protein product [Rotaria sp. Silwood2]CAF3305648.1 unnamed protein product [Rotaria sp. Silwood2]CAF4204167.1 unnamed protein product [Rotaria sp. Silwood2]CAF4396394.1 unnamed protein product [Rotaria sp. Silwood2]